MAERRGYRKLTLGGTGCGGNLAFVGRVLFTLLAFGFAFGESVDRKDWGTGEIVASLHVGKAYEYRILAQGDRYTGRSRKELHVKLGDHVKFAIAGRKIFVIDEDSKTQELRYTRQELMPPRPRPIP